MSHLTQISALVHWTLFAAVALVGGLVTLLFAIETKGRVLEELSP